MFLSVIALEFPLDCGGVKGRCSETWLAAGKASLYTGYLALSSGVTMRNYLQPQTTGDVLRNTFVIYGKGFVPILLTYLLPTLPFQIWQAEAKAANNTALYVVSYFAAILAGLFAFGAIAIAVSDICLGNKPSVMRCYKRVFSTIPGKLLVTNFLTITCWAMPALPLFILPARFGAASDTIKMLILFAMLASFIVAVTVALRLLFASSVVVLEGFWAIEALKRSRALARGLNWRNLAVLILIWVIVVVLVALTSTIFTLLHVKGAFAGRMFTVGIAMIVVPVFFIAVVLLYYDSRVRKEAYDNSALAEDLRR